GHSRAQYWARYRCPCRVRRMGKSHTRYESSTKIRKKMSAAPLDYLLSRRSVKFVQAPGPSEDELGRILQSAMSAPDHGRLQPWRFCLIRGEAIARLAEMTIGAIKSAGLPFPAEKEAGNRRWLDRVPLIIAVACKLDHSNTKIPEHERMLA